MANEIELVQEYTLSWDPFKIDDNGRREPCSPPGPLGVRTPFPHTEVYTSIASACLDGIMMFKHCVKTVPSFQQCAGAKILVYARSTSKVVKEEVVMRGWLICPKCGNAYPKNKTAFTFEADELVADSVLLFDRKEQGLTLARAVERVDRLTCTGCNTQFQVEDVAEGCDNVAWDSLGIRFISSRE